MGKRPVKGTTYKLVLQGELDDRIAYLFNGLQLERAEGTTVLSGEVIDQTQLHGFTKRIEELGLELVALEQTNEPSSGPRPTERGSEIAEASATVVEAQDGGTFDR